MKFSNLEIYSAFLLVVISCVDEEVFADILQHGNRK